MYESKNLKIEDIINIENSTCEKLLGIKVDNKLNFSEHLDGIIKKASRKVSALSRIFPFMDLTKRRFLMNSFFASQFSYCPLIWMCHSRTVNNKINKLHERCLRIVYNDKKSSFKELLETDKSVPIHIKNLQVLATEMFMVYRNISPPIVRQLFQLRNNDYNLRQFSQFDLPNVKSVFCGTESISFLGPKIWNIVPNEFKKETSLDAFKKLIKNGNLKTVHVEKGSNRKKERISKHRLLKGCYQGQNVTALAILERLQFKNFSCRPTTVDYNTFQCSMAPPL